MDYLSVKDVAELLSKSEETIRRKIRERKIEAAEMPSKKEGYAIPVEQLMKRGMATMAQIRQFLASKGMAGEEPKGETQPDAPEGEACEEEAPEDWRGIVEEYEHAQEKDSFGAITRLMAAVDRMEKKKLASMKKLMELQQAQMELQFEKDALERQILQVQEYVSRIRSAAKAQGTAD